MNINCFLLILVGVFLNTAAQLCLKKGMTIVGMVSMRIDTFMEQIMQIVVNAYIITGMICYVISFGVWLVVLSRVEVSLAYPMLSIGYVVTAVIGFHYFGEPLTMYKFVGIATICLGTVFLFKS